MKLHFLGTTGYHPNQRRHTACLMLPEIGLILDAGTGMFRVRDLIATPKLDIFLTHAHLDHVLGLTFMFDVVHQKPVERVLVHAAPEKIDAIEQHLFSPAIFPVKPPFELRPLPKEKILADGARLTHCPLSHPGGSLGYRIDWPDRSLCYITDTTARPNSDYIDFIRGADVLLHECNFRDGFEKEAEQTGHSCTTPVCENARQAGVSRLYLLHLNALDTSDDPVGLDAARAIFPATEIAEDGMIIDV